MSAEPKTTSGDPLLGRVLDGRFRIIAPIARGGMGAVYKAEQAPLGRLVALKVLAPRGDDAGNTEFRRRFLLEASTSAKLTHPNTVRVFDYGQTEDGFFFIAMELLEGKTLKQMIAETGALDPARAIDVAKQVCRSLREAHRMGVIHRDIKPGNVMLVDRGGEEAAKVLDFGLAKDVSATGATDDDATQTGVFLGSPKYVSPEQVQGETIDARSDIYALGVVLYEMLSGHPPFAHEQPMQVLMAHVRDAPPKLAAPEGREPIPPQLENIVMRCLAKNADDRWPDMEALLIALKEWQGTDSVSGDLSLSMSSDRLGQSGLGQSGDARSGVHYVPEPIPTDTPSTGVLRELPAPASAADPSSATSMEMASSGRASGVLVAGVIAVVLAIGAGAFYMNQTPSAPHAAPPPMTASAVTSVTPPATVEVAPEVVAPEVEAPVEAPPIRTVMLSLRSNPTGATVRIGDRTYGPTPTEVELAGELAEPGTELELVFERAGFRPSTEHVTVTESDEPLTLESRMTRAVGARTGGSESETTGTGGPAVHLDGYRDSPY
jgi:serine/threonine-protein kinase